MTSAGKDSSIESERDQNGTIGDLFRDTLQRFNLPTRWEIILLILSLGAIFLLQQGLSAFTEGDVLDSPVELVSLFLPFALVGVTVLFGVYSFIRGFLESSAIPPLRFIIIIGAFMFFLFFLPLLSDIEEPNPQDQNQTAVPGSSGTSLTAPITAISTTEAPQSVPFMPPLITFDILEPRFILFIIIGSIFLGLVLIVVARTVMRQTKTSSQIPEPFSDKIREHVENDREKVIQYYLKGSDALENEGASSDKSMTPREFLGDVQTRFEAPIAPPTRRLTELYEESRFSKHHIKEKHVHGASEATSELLEKIVELKEEEEENELD